MSRYPLETIVLPMGAIGTKKMEKLEALWDDPNYVAEEKLDGSRYIGIEARLFGRRLSVKDGFPVEKTDNAPHIHEILKRYNALIPDGEVYIPGGKSSDVTKIMGCSPEKAIARQEEQGYLQYCLFDLLRANDGTWLLDKPWHERRRALEAFIDFLHSSFPETREYIKITKVAYENKREFCAEIMKNGGEGVILKHKDSIYHPGKKPAWQWVKVKQEMTDDVVITGYKEPEREYTGTELDTWQYWAKKVQNGDQVGEVKYEGDCPPGAGWEPVTKYYYFGWIGSVRVGKYRKVKIGETVDPRTTLTFMTDDGVAYVMEELGSCSGLTEGDRKEFSANPDKFIGEAVEISAMETTEDGHYRHIQFKCLRPDKNPEECTIDETK